MHTGTYTFPPKYSFCKFGKVIFGSPGGALAPHRLCHSLVCIINMWTGVMQYYV